MLQSGIAADFLTVDLSCQKEAHGFLVKMGLMQGSIRVYTGVYEGFLGDTGTVIVPYQG